MTIITSDVDPDPYHFGHPDSGSENSVKIIRNIRKIDIYQFLKKKSHFSLTTFYKA